MFAMVIKMKESTILNERTYASQDSFKVDMKSLGEDLNYLAPESTTISYDSGDYKGAQFTVEVNKDGKHYSIELYAYQSQSSEVNMYSEDGSINVWGKKPYDLLKGII
jgi:hypothetical protein